GLAILALHCRIKMCIRHLPTIAKRQQRGVQGSIANLAAGHIAAARYLLQEVLAHAVLLWEVALPDEPAFGRFWRGKVDDDIQAAREGGIDAVASVGRNQHNAFVVFEAL